MLTFSIVWVTLAATITIIAMMRKSSAAKADGLVRASDSDKPLLVLAAAYGLVLLTGFIYVGKFLVSSL